MYLLTFHHCQGRSKVRPYLNATVKLNVNYISFSNEMTKNTKRKTLNKLFYVTTAPKEEIIHGDLFIKNLTLSDGA